MDTLRAVQRFETAAGEFIFQIPLEVFPRFWAYVYWVQSGDLRVLIDTGSGYGNSNEHLEAGLAAASEMSGLDCSLENLTHVLITHGHIDHFGGLSYVRTKTAAQVGVHELDRRNLTNYEERLTVVGNRLNRFLMEAGLEDEKRRRLLELYQITKRIYQSVPVDFTYENIGMRLGPFEFLHTPGHCAGHVVIRLGDILFSGDHILAGTSPHQAPEHLTLSTGLAHYLESLEKVKHWSQGVRLILGGHKQPVEDLEQRVGEIRELHMRRLDQVMELLREPLTVGEVCDGLFPEVEGYNILLAIEEAGAHVEYLYQRGRINIDNLKEVERGEGSAAIRYRRSE